jgi:acylphosphatase
MGAMPMAKSYHTWEVLVDGRVQGVGYRYSAQQWARELGVTGWVRNEPDGSVRVLAQHADSHVLSELVRLLRGGPPRAVVTSLEVFPLDGTGPSEHTAFEIQR